MRVCVIGGSVAGLECGINLADSLDVTIFEEHQEIGYPLKCAEGWINFSGLKPYVRGRSIERVVINLLDENLRIADSFEIEENVVQIINRPEMEQKMAEIAESSGAEIVTGRKMTIKEATEKFDVVIDASGYPSQWCREFGGKKAYGFGMQAFYERDFDYISIFLKKGLDGYFWIFPMADGGCKVGVGVFTRYDGRLKKLLEKFLDTMGFGKPSKLTASPIGCYPNLPLVRYHRTPVALVGDAAGLVDRGGGEGMSKAVISARILSDCIINGSLESYEKRYFSFMRMHYFVANFFGSVRKNWTLTKIFGRAAVWSLAVRLMNSHYSNMVHDFL
ncbi:NAD(P)/FAD-dependent oxidoreductase [Archaeoglobus neptunius]|uniref:NAD(P)/FAD-dependent oxidoreductase n=1 Tax=Archaeoglobus neptunius TaxID=2798580 RepID=UPI001927CD80|nr:NAD(P)/FAD-dependent oxidoreductase [Archaeoglobus neptunius]